MAYMSGYDDDFEGEIDFADDDDWLYVEDEFALADELAENQVADPGYSGTQYEIDLDCYEFELFAYWNDIEYNDDLYWDSPGCSPRDGKARSVRSTHKPKRPTSNTSHLLSAREVEVASTTSIAPHDVDPLVFRSREKRSRLSPGALNRTTDEPPFAFLADWRERLKFEEAQVPQRPMPEAMQRATSATMAAGLSTMSTRVKAHVDKPHETHSNYTATAGEEGGSYDQLLQSNLTRQLDGVGLDDLNASAILQSLVRIVSAGEDLDLVSGELADRLLGSLEDQNTAGNLTDWLTRQGVSLDTADDDDEETEGLRDQGDDGVRLAMEPRAGSGLQSAEGSSETSQAANGSGETSIRTPSGVGRRKRKASSDETNTTRPSPGQPRKSARR